MEVPEGGTHPTSAPQSLQASIQCLLHQNQPLVMILVVTVMMVSNNNNVVMAVVMVLIKVMLMARIKIKIT